MSEDRGVPRLQNEPVFPRWLKVLLILGAVLACLLAGAWAVLSVVAIQDIEAAMAEVEALGGPRYLRDLYYGEVPPSQNAAHVYERAFDALTMSEDDLMWHICSLARWATMDPKEATTIDNFLRNNKSTLELLHQAAAMPECLFDVHQWQVYFTETPYDDALEGCVLLLRFATLQALVDGRTEEALEHWYDSIALVNRFADHKLAQFEAERLFGLCLSMNALEACVQSGRLTERQLKDCLRVLDAIELRASFTEAIQSELAAARNCFAPPLTGFRTGCGFRVFPFDDSERWLYRLYVSPLGRPWRLYDESVCLRLLIEDVRLGTAPYSQVSGGVQRSYGKLGTLSRVTPVTQALFEWRTHPRYWFYEAEAELTVVRTALLVELYRLAHGDYPGTLTDLLPDWLPVVPVDPYDGRPLRYINSDGRVSVYSVGSDLQDNQGTEQQVRGEWQGDDEFTLREAPVQPTQGPRHE